MGLDRSYVLTARTGASFVWTGTYVSYGQYWTPQKSFGFETKLDAFRSWARHHHAQRLPDSEAAS